MKNWKTTANGFLTAILAAAGPLTAYLATVNSPKAATASGVITLIAAIARVWIGLIQVDSPASAVK
jgi:hypothetical protein